MARKICGKLKLFYNATEFFSRSKYPTSNTYFVKICEIREALSKWMVCGDEVIVAMSKKMFDKFEKYWSVVHVVMAIVVTLDPRYKMRVVEFYFPSIYGEVADFEIQKVKSICYDLLEEYQSKNMLEKSTSICDKSTSSLGDLVDEEEGESMVKLVQFLSSNTTTVHIKSELDHYLEEPVLPWSQDFDILNWWKTNGIKYPTLQLIARDFLAIPVSTVASESAFSTGGRVVSLHRSRLHPDTLEALMCSQNWLWNELQGNNIILFYIRIFYNLLIVHLYNIICFFFPLCLLFRFQIDTR